MVLCRLLIDLSISSKSNLSINKIIATGIPEVTILSKDLFQNASGAPITTTSLSPLEAISIELPNCLPSCPMFHFLPEIEPIPGNETISPKSTE